MLLAMKTRLIAIVAAVFAASSLVVAQCGSGTCDEAKPTSVAVDATLAKKLAEEARKPMCSTISRRDFLTHLPFVGNEAGAEALVAKVREAADVDCGAKIILAAAASAKTHSATPPAARFPEKLSATGFYGSTAKREAAKGFESYAVNVHLWSDGAAKDRFVKVPEGKSIAFRPGGAFDVPIGTVFLQTLYLTEGAERRLTETRVIVKEADGLRFASYAWNDEQTDADLRPDGDEFFANVGSSTQLWRIESQESCSRCHNEAASESRILGFNAPQLNRMIGDENQIARLAKRKVVAGVPADLVGVPALADPYDPKLPLEARVRSYLHVNCSSCHRPGGPGSGTLDLRVETALSETGLLRPRATSSRGAVVRPGKPERSTLLARMHSVDWDRMPSLLSTVPDDAGIALLRTWIASLAP